MGTRTSYSLPLMLVVALRLLVPSKYEMAVRREVWPACRWGSRHTKQAQRRCTWHTHGAGATPVRVVAKGSRRTEETQRRCVCVCVCVCACVWCCLAAGAVECMNSC